MRGCTVQQALTPEAATLVKQAVNLARRRGHAQVTPLHVASTMLSSSTCLLRAACLQSHSHPLQCKALELCFNVALNRLPASAVSAPMLGGGGGGHYHHHHHPPTLSNALVAAFKRAQAHQRRGSIESQQQPLLAVKIELEQLVISILDDPSVSRVMREAGFSSTQVKSNVELAVSSSPTTPSSSPPRKSKLDATTIARPYPSPQAQAQPRSMVHVKDEDLNCVIEALSAGKKRSLVLLGECLDTSDGVVRGLMERLEKGSEVPEAMNNVKFMNFPLSSLKDMPREEVDQKLGELSCHVNSFFHGGGRGVALYLGDLKWPAEISTRGERSGVGGGERRSNHCPVMDHVVMEIRSMVSNGDEHSNNNGRFWLLGIATYQTFMRCSAGYPSLVTLWDLQPLTVPSGSLNLSLSFDSDSKRKSSSKASGDGSFWSSMGLDGSRSHQLSCCADCSINFENEARNLSNNSHSNRSSVASTLPSWLQQYKRDNPRTSDGHECLQIRHLRRKWNTISLQQHQSEITFNFSSVSPSYSISSDHTNLHQVQQQTWQLPSDPSKHHPWISSRRNSAAEIINLELRPSNPNSASSSSRGTMQMEYCSFSKFKEHSAENLKILCTALEKKVPWQKDIIPEIASTILQCRSGTINRRRKLDQPFFSGEEVAKEETWLFFQGGDKEGKERVARELANLIFGSYSSFVSISDHLETFSLTKSGSTDDQIVRHKRSKADQPSHGCRLERLFEALCENSHRVVLMEDVEQMDSRTQAGIKHAIERGKMKSYNGDEVTMSDSIIILSCESLDCRSRACSPDPVKCKTASDHYHEEDKEEYASDQNEVSSSCNFALDLNLCAEDENDDMDEYYCSTSEDAKLLDLVDRAFFFKLHEDL